MSFDPVAYAMGKAGAGRDLLSALMGAKNSGGGGGGGDIPKEYQKVEYLTNDGDCWCEIDFQIEISNEIEVEFSIPADASRSECAFVGYVNQWEIYTINDRVEHWGTYISGGGTPSITRETRTTYTTTFVKKPSNTWMWGRYKSNAYPFVGNLYCCVLYSVVESTKEKILELVPCYRKADNVPGFYDVINSTFYTNQGTGTFGIGPNVT